MFRTARSSPAPALAAAGAAVTRAGAAVVTGAGAVVVTGAGAVVVTGGGAAVVTGAAAVVVTGAAAVVVTGAGAVVVTGAATAALETDGPDGGATNRSAPREEPLATPLVGGEAVGAVVEGAIASARLSTRAGAGAVGVTGTIRPLAAEPEFADFTADEGFGAVDCENGAGLFVRLDSEYALPFGVTVVGVFEGAVVLVCEPTFVADRSPAGVELGALGCAPTPEAVGTAVNSGSAATRDDPSTGSKYCTRTTRRTMASETDSAVMTPVTNVERCAPF
jgi:hypothetical protein